MNFPEDRRYPAGHLWAQPQEDGTVLVGITDYAQDQLGDVIFIELPAEGDEFAQGQSCASIESAKVTSDALMPVSGTVVAVNEKLADEPELLNAAPYGAGWIVRIKPAVQDEAGTLVASEYAASLGA